MEQKFTLSSDIVSNWKSPSKFFWRNPVTAVSNNLYLFVQILSFWDYSEHVAVLLHSLCKSKRLLSIENDGESSKIIMKMCITKNITEIFTSETFEAREKEWALTEASLMQTSILSGKPLRIYIDKATDITLVRQMYHMFPRARIEEMFVTQRSLQEYQDKERKIARSLELQSEMLNCLNDFNPKTLSIIMLR
jgi:hypothetical protein